MAMAHSQSSIPHLILYLFALQFQLPLSLAQVGTITQEITKTTAYGLQKACARNCFQDEPSNFCPNDVLGSKLGCAPHTDCNKYSWVATNDCYCRPDLQSIAQAHLTSCVKRSCSVGDFAIDASSAGSIYSQYCKDKGYIAALPATVLATTTGNGKTITTAATGVGTTPTSTSSSTSDSGSSSGSSGLPITTIIGIVIGGLAGLAILSFILKKFELCFGHKKEQPVQYRLPLADQKATYHVNPHYESYHPSGYGSEIGPNDSISIVGGPTRPAPTLVSAAGYPQYR